MSEQEKWYWKRFLELRDDGSRLEFIKQRIIPEELSSKDAEIKELMEKNKSLLREIDEAEQEVVDLNEQVKNERMKVCEEIEKELESISNHEEKDDFNAGYFSCKGDVEQIIQKVRGQ